MRCSLLTLALCLATGAHAAQEEQRLREELERQLQELVRIPPPELELTFEGLAVADHALVQAEFLVDGEPVATLEGSAVKGPGPYRLGLRQVAEGSHQLVSRVTYENTSWNPLDPASGHRWKLVASVGFLAQRGLRVRVRATATYVPEAKRLDERLKLSHDLQAEMMVQVEEVVLAEPEPPEDGGVAASEPVAARVPRPPADAGVFRAESPQLLPSTPLERPEDRRARLRLKVLSRGRPVAASVSVRGEGLKMEAGADSALALPPGRYTLEVVARGHLAQVRQVQISQGAQALQSFNLEREPKRRRVRLKGDRLELKKALTYKEGQKLPRPQELSVVGELVDVLVRGRVERLRVVGHTDSREAPEGAQALSEARARAVADLLVGAGVAPERLEVVGLGDVRPMAPNLTPRGRQMNRRVELIALPLP